MHITIYKIDNQQGPIMEKNLRNNRCIYTHIYIMYNWITLLYIWKLTHYCKSAILQFLKKREKNSTFWGSKRLSQSHLTNRLVPAAPLWGQATFCPCRPALWNNRLFLCSCLSFICFIHLFSHVPPEKSST